MRSLFVALAGLMLFAGSLFTSGAAQAKIAITVNKDTQTMTVAIDGVERYQWPVSTGNPSHETPNGSFRTFRMEADHYSKEFDDAPMPHSIFFTKFGHAIHGTESEGKLGTPVSHGCVRLSRANATTLYDMVQKDGVLNTTVTLTGSSQVALARNPRLRSTAVARRDPGAQHDLGTQRDLGTQYGSAGDPTELTPRRALPGQYAPQQVQRADDGYIYPADGNPDATRYPAPRNSRRIYDAQGYNNQGYNDQSYQQPQYDDNRGYAPQPYYQPRGLFQ